MKAYELRVKLAHVNKSTDKVRQGIIDYVAQHSAIPSFCWNCCADALSIVEIDEPEYCADCGEVGERTGHQSCPYPRNYNAR